jgi:hypothetical protein
MTTNSLFFFFCYIYKTRKSFTLRPCVRLLLSSSSSLRQCIYIFFFHFNRCSRPCSDGDFVCTGMLFSAVVVLFLLFFVFFSIRLTLAMVSILRCLSFSFLLCYNPLYSRTLMSFLLCTFMFCYDACHMYFSFRSDVKG